ncbi:unnamed protein product [Trichogramma brassicae]|uniref:Peptidase S1 domain-containing protein n=1 Tax=Trichogramma brassicae TaxID=86971 RepID=A0A6H5J109_9HYME|nr:unnamed protein product [Trichogramma brassicae]
MYVNDCHTIQYTESKQTNFSRICEPRRAYAVRIASSGPSAWAASSGACSPSRRRTASWTSAANRSTIARSWPRSARRTIGPRESAPRSCAPICRRIIGNRTVAWPGCTIGRTAVVRLARNVVKMPNSHELKISTLPRSYVFGRRDTSLVAGYGKKRTDPTYGDSRLRYAMMKPVDDEVCGYNYLLGDDDTVFCAAITTAKTGASVCEGDDGTPYVQRSGLAGILSHVPADCSGASDAIFTKIGPYRQFIQRAMANDIDHTIQSNRLIATFPPQLELERRTVSSIVFKRARCSPVNFSAVPSDAERYSQVSPTSNATQHRCTMATYLHVIYVASHSSARAVSKSTFTSSIVVLLVTGANRHNDRLAVAQLASPQVRQPHADNARHGRRAVVDRVGDRSRGRRRCPRRQLPGRAPRQPEDAAAGSADRGRGSRLPGRGQLGRLDNCLARPRRPLRRTGLRLVRALPRRGLRPGAPRHPGVDRQRGHAPGHTRRHLRRVLPARENVVLDLPGDVRGVDRAVRLAERLAVSSDESGPRAGGREVGDLVLSGYRGEEEDKRDTRLSGIREDRSSERVARDHPARLAEILRLHNSAVHPAESQRHDDRTVVHGGDLDEDQPVRYAAAGHLRKCDFEPRDPRHGESGRQAGQAAAADGVGLRLRPGQCRPRRGLLPRRRRRPRLAAAELRRRLSGVLRDRPGPSAERRPQRDLRRRHQGRGRLPGVAHRRPQRLRRSQVVSAALRRLGRRVGLLRARRVLEPLRPVGPAAARDQGKVAQRDTEYFA